MKCLTMFSAACLMALTASAAFAADEGTGLVVNELMASNVGVVMSPATNFDSWMELYNPGDEDVPLEGMCLSNDETNLTLWRMPAGVGSVPAKGFLVVWLGSGDVRSSQAPFKLDCDGGTLCLSDRSGQLVTSVTYPPAMSRTAWARKTDGGDEWGWTADATPGASNHSAVFADTRLEAPVVSTGSQLFSGEVAFHVDIPEGATLMYTTDGSVPLAPSDEGSEGGDVPSWIDWIKNGDCEGDDASCLVSKHGNGSNTTTFVEGAGYQGSRGIRIQSKDNPAQVWDTQFFVYTPDHTWQAGETYRFSMKVRAERADRITPQSQRTPGSYIHWDMLGGSINVTTDWKEYTYEGVITDEQSGGGTMQTIAFHLNESRKANVFYFDDIVWEAYNGGNDTGGAQRSNDGQFAVTRTTNYVFRLFRDGYLPSVPVTRSFIKRDKYLTIPIVSIVGDDRYFNDPVWGIDVKGTNGIPGNGRDDAVNWNQPWDRPVNFTYISPTEGMLFSQDVNISVSGGWSRQDSPRSLKLKSGKVFDGQNHLDYAFFPQKPYIRSKALLVRNGGNDSWSRFKDPALTAIVQRSGIDLDVQSTVQVAEYVNGQFRGILNLREPNNDKFVYANWGYDDEEIDAFENTTFKNGTDEAFNRLLELSEHINDTGVLDEVRTLLDIDEFTNYMAAELYLGNSDWPNNNVKGYRNRDDGRFRFVLFDLDQVFNYWCAMTSISTLETNAEFARTPLVRLFRNLLRNDAYRKKFIDTFCLMGGSVFERQRVSTLVTELADAMRPMQQLEGRNPDGSANEIKQQLNGRLDVAINQLKEYKPVQLQGLTRMTVKLSSGTDGATLLVNGLEVPYASFNGYLYAPVTVEAKAPAGYTFAGWRKTVGSRTETLTDAVISVTDASVSLTAIFESTSQQVNGSTSGQVNGSTSPVRINEVSAANNIYVNEFFRRNDWVELYNTTSQPVDVEGMYLSDNPDQPKKYQISKSQTQASTLIPPHGHLIVWCDKREPLSQLHAPFNLDADGGAVVLTAADESWSDRIAYSAMRGDETVCRYPDGANQVFIMNVPTIAKANIVTSYATFLGDDGQSGIDAPEMADSGSFRIGFAHDCLTVRSAHPIEAAELAIYTVTGQLLAQHTLSLADGYAEHPLGTLPAGSYVARLTDGYRHTAICKFIIPN